jgi:2-polyprenyl-6-methoxyphenol hydroxylase-like FAD-dependent oxidoreductase
MTADAHLERNHAVVLGGSIAGLLAARVLAEHYRNVTVVDRDLLPEHAAPRRCVPQDRHGHGLLPRGAKVLEELLPGLLAELVRNGAVHGDATRDVAWCVSGVRFKGAESGLGLVIASRPLLETHVRARVTRLANVSLRPASEAVGLVDEDGRIRGVRIRARGEATEELLDADLVVDATGRGSRAPAWLEEMGFASPHEETLDVGIGYASCIFNVGRDVLGGWLAVVHGATDDNPRGAVAQIIEGGRVQVSLTGYRGNHPPTDPAGFAAHAATLRFPEEIHAAVVRGEPLESIASYRLSKTVRRRYDRMERFPEGFLVLGDAACAFNPVYAQGMTVAALEAAALRDCLQSAERELARVFFRRAARIIDTPWKMAVGGDLAMSSIEGPRTFPVKAVNAWIRKLHAAAAHDSTVATAFIRVASLIDPPAKLFAPGLMLRVLGRREPEAPDAPFGNV